MRRREFTAGLLLASMTRSAWAQQRAIPKIALFHPAIPTTLLTETGGGTAWRAFFSELRRLGYVEGQNLAIQRYSAEGHHERYADIAREIVNSNPDLIVTGPNPVVLAFKAVTNSIPIVAFMIDPLKAGLVASLARPLGNLTGITLDPGIEIWGKRLELLKEAVPSATRTAFLGMREGWEGSFGQAMRDIANRLGISLLSMLTNGGTTAEIERVFAEMAGERPDGVLVT
jgi:putative tryptophan/tyrosine transport system substrate-binding protein